MINDEILKELSNLNCITPLAYAGHGKGYMVDLIGSGLNKKCLSLSFSDPIKSIIAKSFSKNKLKSITELTPEYNKSLDMDDNKSIYEYFEYLKNERHDVKVFQELNMREFMIFVMGDDFLLHADPEIKVKLACLDAIKNIEKHGNVLFIADSTRYEEEILFTFLLNQSDDMKSFFESYISSNRKPNNISILQERLMDIRLSLEKTLSPEDTETISSLFMNVAQNMHEMLSIDGNNIDIKNLILEEKSNYFKSNQHKKMVDYGVIHIFRPLLPRNYKGSENLDNSIIDYTGISIDELKSIRKNYLDYNIEFNPSNIHDYGYLRSNPNHLSEKSLAPYKGVAIINKPKMSISDLLNQMSYIKDRISYLEPKKNKINGQKNNSYFM